MRVYITNFSFSLIFRSLHKYVLADNRNELIEFVAGELVDLEISAYEIDELLSNQDLKNIKLFQIALSDLEKIEMNKNSIQKFIDKENEEFDKEIKTSAYHYDNNCEWMKKDFINSIGGKEVRRKNSGVFEGDVINRRLDDYIDKVKSKHTQLRFFFDYKFAEKIRNYRYAPSNKILKNPKLLQNEPEDVKNRVLEFHQIKREFIGLIYGMLIEKYNPNFEFEKGVLDHIGFRECRACKSKKEDVEDKIPF